MNINYIELLNNDFVFSLTNNILKSKDVNIKLEKHYDRYLVKINNNISDIYNCSFTKKILNCIHIYQKTIDDPLILFKLQNNNLINKDNFDINLYNTISVSLLSNENRILKKRIAELEYSTYNSNKKRRVSN